MISSAAAPDAPRLVLMAGVATLAIVASADDRNGAASKTASGARGWPERAWLISGILGRRRARVVREIGST